MPAYNVEKYIFDSIKSIKSQLFKDWELVVLDDSSTDNTYSVVKTILDTTMEPDIRIKLYKREEHCGKIGKLKNECIALLGDCDYICHVGSDDIIPTNCLQVFVDYMEKNLETGVCCGNFICFNDEGKEWTFPHVANSGQFNSNTLLQYMCLFPMRFYRKEIVDKVGGYSEVLTSAVDYDLALKTDEITKIHRIKEPITYFYRQHSGQVSSSKRPEQDLNAKVALQAALGRRNINGIVLNDKPPFKIQYFSNPWKKA
jgi:glycosyltransferase involved in cell wall biosynthesis